MPYQESPSIALGVSVDNLKVLEETAARLSDINDQISRARSLSGENERSMQGVRAIYGNVLTTIKQLSSAEVSRVNMTKEQLKNVTLLNREQRLMDQEAVKRYNQQIAEIKNKRLTSAADDERIQQLTEQRDIVKQQIQESRLADVKMRGIRVAGGQIVDAEVVPQGTAMGEAARGVGRGLGLPIGRMTGAMAVGYGAYKATTWALNAEKKAEDWLVSMGRLGIITGETGKSMDQVSQDIKNQQIVTGLTGEQLMQYNRQLAETVGASREQKEAFNKNTQRLKLMGYERGAFAPQVLELQRMMGMRGGGTGNIIQAMERQALSMGLTPGVFMQRMMPGMETYTQEMLRRGITPSPEEAARAVGMIGRISPTLMGPEGASAMSGVIQTLSTGGATAGEAGQGIVMRAMMGKYGPDMYSIKKAMQGDVMEYMPDVLNQIRKEVGEFDPRTEQGKYAIQAASTLFPDIKMRHFEDLAEKIKQSELPAGAFGPQLPADEILKRILTPDIGKEELAKQTQAQYQQTATGQMEQKIAEKEASERAVTMKAAEEFIGFKASFWSTFESIVSGRGIPQAPVFGPQLPEETGRMLPEAIRPFMQRMDERFEHFLDKTIRPVVRKP